MQFQNPIKNYVGYTDLLTGSSQWSSTLTTGVYGQSESWSSTYTLDTPNFYFSEAAVFYDSSTSGSTLLLDPGAVGDCEALVLVYLSPSGYNMNVPLIGLRHASGAGAFSSYHIGFSLDGNGNANQWFLGKQIAAGVDTLYYTRPWGPYYYGGLVGWIRLRVTGSGSGTGTTIFGKFWQANAQTEPLDTDPTYTMTATLPAGEASLAPGYPALYWRPYNYLYYLSITLGTGGDHAPFPTPLSSGVKSLIGMF